MIYLCFLDSLYGVFMIRQLPGVDPNDPSVKDLLASMQSQSEVSVFYYILRMNSIFPYN